MTLVHPDSSFGSSRQVSFVPVGGSRPFVREVGAIHESIMHAVSTSFRPRDEATNKGRGSSSSSFVLGDLLPRRCKGRRRHCRCIATNDAIMYAISQRDHHFPLSGTPSFQRLSKSLPDAMKGLDKETAPLRRVGDGSKVTGTS